MADVTISGNVTPNSLANVKTGIAQVAITAGQTVYIDASNGGKVNLADADAEASAVCVGVAVADADVGGAVPYVVNGGTVTVSGAPFTKGVFYYVSTTAGGIAPVADLSAADYVTIVGVATSTSVLKIAPVVSGVTL